MAIIDIKKDKNTSTTKQNKTKSRKTTLKDNKFKKGIFIEEVVRNYNGIWQ